jgi:predicted transporter
MGMIMIITGSFTLLMFFIAFIVGLSTQNVFQDLASSLALIGAGLAQLLAGIRYIKRQRKADKQN